MEGKGRLEVLKKERKEGGKENKMGGVEREDGVRRFGWWYRFMWFGRVVSS